MNNRALIFIALGVLVLFILVVVARSRGGKPARYCGGCNRVMLPVWTKCLFCGWQPMARLEFILGPLVNQTIPLIGDVTTVGSAEGNTIVLADPGVSKKHAGIRKLESAFELADLGSTNGVYVNGVKVPKKILEPGDIIRVGNTEAVFRRE